MYFRCLKCTNKQVKELLWFFKVLDDKLLQLPQIIERNRSLGINTEFEEKALDYCNKVLIVKNLFETKLSEDLELYNLYEQLYVENNFDEINNKNIKEVSQAIGVEPRVLRKAKEKIYKTLKEILNQPMRLK